MEKALFDRVWNWAIFVVKQQSPPFVVAEPDDDARSLVVRIPMERRLLILVDLNAVPDQLLIDSCNQPLASKEQLWEFVVVRTGHQSIFDVIFFCQTECEPKYTVHARAAWLYDEGPSEPERDRWHRAGPARPATASSAWQRRLCGKRGHSLWEGQDAEGLAFAIHRYKNYRRLPRDLA